MSRQPRERADQVLLDFQSVMEQFLAIQRDVLNTYLSSARACAVHAHAADGMPDPARVAPESSHAPHRALEEPPVIANVSADSLDASPLVRLTLHATPRPAPSVRASLARDRAVVITDDGGGVAVALAERLEREGHRVAIVRTADAGARAHGALTCSLQSADETEALVQSISSSCRGIAAIIHLLPLSPKSDFERMTTEAAWKRLWLETGSLFLLAKAARAGLEAAAADGGAAVIGVTAMGGAFGSEAAQTQPSFFPGQAGVVGFAKCLALEWPQVRVKAVDLDPRDAPDELARHIFDELWAADAEVEVGYSNGTRVGLDLVQVPAVLDPGFELPSDAVVLATGGARGITAEACLEIAERYQPTFVLIGQTPLPDAAEPQEIAGLESAAELKRALLARLGRDGTRVSVSAVEKAYHQLLREREIRRNVGALTATGARVHYVALDIRDDEAFAAVIADIYSTYGRLDGVIHGAGIIEDKLVHHKSVESFERVLATKARSAFVLSRCLRPESLRFAVLFSSVAGRFGNRGQADYAAANEVVNKLAVLLDRRSPARVCSINWAPWDKRGMVSPELKREFMARGVELLAPSAGRRAFWEEIQQPGTSRPEIVIAASPRAALMPPAARPRPAEKRPLMTHATRRTNGPDVAQYQRLLDPAIDQHLHDHRLDGRPVLPLAFAAEMMAEAAHATWPDLTVLAVRNLQLLKGIAIEADAPVPLTIEVRAAASARDSVSRLADVEITTPSSSPIQRYRGVVELASRPAAAPSFTAPDEPLQPFTLALPDAYRLWTFHGPAFRRITSIEGIGRGSMIGQVYSSSAQSGIASLTPVQWSIDPFVFDCALQMLLMWSRAHNDKTALPSRFRAFSCFGPLSDIPLRCYVRVESLAGGHALRSHVHFVGPDGQVLGLLEGMEASCTAALNRLAVH